MSEPIDVVIAWVDGSDSEWLAEKRKYDPKTPLPGNAGHHFRDWGTLRYLFRGIETYMPWVRTVHFVTWGHLPEWLDVSCPRLHLVRHEDYIPAEYLPTFSSHVIELNFHRIEGLAERFIYFNDDQFVIRPATENHFFDGMLPRDVAALNVHCYALSRPVDLIQIRDVGVVNEHFGFRASLRTNWRKWLRLSSGTVLLRTLLLLGCPRFAGFYQTHCAQPLLKSTYKEVWAAEPEVLDSTCRNKFRGPLDVNQWVMREWQMASGRFTPRSASFSRAFYLEKNNPVEGVRAVVRELARPKHSLICVNDAAMSNSEFDECRQLVVGAFEQLLPAKSSFELEGV